MQSAVSYDTEIPILIALSHLRMNDEIENYSILSFFLLSFRRWFYFTFNPDSIRLSLFVVMTQISRAEENHVQLSLGRTKANKLSAFFFTWNKRYRFVSRRQQLNANSLPKKQNYFLISVLTTKNRLFIFARMALELKSVFVDSLKTLLPLASSIGAP